MGYKLKPTFEQKRRMIRRRKAVKYWGSLSKAQLLELTRHHGMHFSKLTTKRMLVEWLDYHIHERSCEC